MSVCSEDGFKVFQFVTLFSCILVYVSVTFKLSLLLNIEIVTCKVKTMEGCVINFGYQMIMENSGEESEHEKQLEKVHDYA